jgi:hypothetical protein
MIAPFNTAGLNVRFTPESGHRGLFDHLVGRGK